MIEFKNTLKIIFVFIGLVIGAGFASGREIIEYFNFSSNSDFTGIALACILFIFICYIILEKSYNKNLYTIYDYISSMFKNTKPLRLFFLYLIFFDLVCGLIVMLSSCGEIVSSVFYIDKIYGSIFLALCCFLVFIFDIKGIAFINIILVPLIMAIMIFTTLSSIFSHISEPAFSMILDPKSHRNILLTSVFYVSYNTLTASSVLSPLTENIKSHKTILISSFLSGIMIGMLIFLVWFSLGLNFNKVWFESFPLKKLAENINTNFSHIYSLCLIMSIFTTAISEGYGILSYFKADTLYKRVIVSLIMFICLVPFSCISFVNLVRYLYYYIGMIGTVWMIIILFDYLKGLNK